MTQFQNCKWELGTEFKHEVWLSFLPSPESAFLSDQYSSAYYAMDNITALGNAAIVNSGDPFSFLALDLGSSFAKFKIDMVTVALRIDCCRHRFHDVQVTVGNSKPTDPLRKWRHKSNVDLIG